MVTDTKVIEQLVEIITHEVLASMLEKREKENVPEGGHCKFTCAESQCVRTCFDRAGNVVNAGAERLSSTIGVIPQNIDLAKMIDHTLLKPDATQEQIAQLCFEARKHGFASVCINPTWVELCAKLLEGSSVKVCTVIGFPLGATSLEVKVFETQVALDHGATEIDMVINVGALKARDLDLVAKDIRGVVIAAHARNAIVKVIIEAILLNDEEATVHDVALMRKVVGPEMGVKAAGGVRTYEDAENMIKAGATRIGASAGVKIIQGPSQEQALVVSAPARN
jgi:deoxyribose-phosphate aldolase